MDIATGTRASDAERRQVVDLLARHLSEGRLDLTEYDERVARVYATVTRDDLRLVLSDLPEPPDRRDGHADTATSSKRSARVPIWQRIEGTAWLGVGLLCVAIWGMVSIGVGELTYPWPIWVIGPWGAVLVFRVLTGWEAGPRPPRPGVTGCRSRSGATGYGQSAATGYGRPAATGYGRPAATGYGRPAATGYGRPAASAPQPVHSVPDGRVR
ncbi:DUF1707 domain-containing protein [Nocardia sp. BMG51109]|uniref:DUF1707 SHOCT-like domain-containing protein n=1 Tax=Nocardia sp. BMG51109 TaxID=1056816 RepID=UPI000465CE62|nr:DUF1707 domain-containing protein [Nocardia sp. BMG51109]